MLRRLHSWTASSNRSRLHAAGAALLLAYLLLFSALSLFHVYTADELADADGCAIGSWLHLGQQAVLLLLFYVAAAPSGFIQRPDRSLAPWARFGDDRRKRGPPFAPAFC